MTFAGSLTWEAGALSTPQILWWVLGAGVAVGVIDPKTRQQAVAGTRSFLQQANPFAIQPTVADETRSLHKPLESTMTRDGSGVTISSPKRELQEPGLSSQVVPGSSEKPIKLSISAHTGHKKQEHESLNPNNINKKSREVIAKEITQLHRRNPADQVQPVLAFPSTKKSIDYVVKKGNPEDFTHDDKPTKLVLLDPATGKEIKVYLVHNRSKEPLKDMDLSVAKACDVLLCCHPNLLPDYLRAKHPFPNHKGRCYVTEYQDSTGQKRITFQNYLYDTDEPEEVTHTNLHASRRPGEALKEKSVTIKGKTYSAHDLKLLPNRYYLLPDGTVIKEF